MAQVRIERTSSKEDTICKEEEVKRTGSKDNVRQNNRERRQSEGTITESIKVSKRVASWH
jgi:hypothetical protein